MGSFEVKRSASIAAPPEKVHGLIDEFREWRTWPPWEEIDPNLERTYGGSERAVGAAYSWKGSRKAGEGAMEITASTPEQIDVGLRFIKPFKAKTGSSSRSRPRDQVARLMRLAGIHGGRAGARGWPRASRRTR
jgi:hypothetical protein